MKHAVCGSVLRLATMVGIAGLCLTTVAGMASGQQNTLGLSPFVAGGFSRSGGATAGIGYNVQGGLDVRLPIRYFRLRADGLFADWSARSDSRVYGFTGSVVATPLPDARLSPYLTAGLGGYTMASNGMRGGWMLGTGFSLRNGVFAESRLHTIRRSPTDLMTIRDGDMDKQWKAIWMPLSIGLRF